MKSLHLPYPFEIQSERLIIRSPDPAYIQDINSAIHETIDQLQTWMIWATPAPTMEDSRENCEKAIANFKDASDYQLWIFLRENNEFVGASGMHRINWKVPSVEIGYWQRASMQGNGYITEAVNSIAGYAFEQIGARRVEIRMSADNTNSWKVAERAGFELEGILRNESIHRDGSLRDTKVYAKIVE